MQDQHCYIVMGTRISILVNRHASASLLQNRTRYNNILLCLIAIIIPAVGRTYCDDYLYTLSMCYK